MCPEAPPAPNLWPLWCGCWAVETGSLGGGRVRTIPLAQGRGGRRLCLRCPGHSGGDTPREREARQPGVGPGVGGTAPLWASVFSPEWGASRSQGQLLKGWPIQKAEAKSVQVGTRRQSPPGALLGGSGGSWLPTLTELLGSPLHTCMPTAPLIQQTCMAHRGLGARHMGSLPLQRRGWARSCAQMGACLKLSPSGLHRAGPPPEVTSPEDPRPHSHPLGYPQRDPAVWPECEHGLCGLGGGQISAELQPRPSPGPPCSPGPLTARGQALPCSLPTTRCPDELPGHQHRGAWEGRGRKAHRPGAVPQVLGTVSVAVVLRQLRGSVAVIIPQGGVHAVGQQGLAALQEGGRHVTTANSPHPPS